MARVIALEGYSIAERLTQGRTTVVHRGKRLSDGAPVIIKVLDLEYPTPLQLARVHHEYELLKRVDHPGVIKVYALERSMHSLAIVMEDFGGVPLRSVIAGNALDLGTKLTIARRIAEIIGSIHASNIIHKDINPSNILLNPYTSEIKIIDFGIASQLPQEIPQLESPDYLEGTLAYIAPEQTGRMNRPVDYRSDFYSFGITLYELLLGTLPFDARDSVEMVHMHMAAVPPSLHSRDASIPEAVSMIVQKLIEKNAENRYRSAVGIIRDLDACLAGAPADFVPGRHDRSDRFTVPARLYGRDDEVERLFGAYEAACAGRPGVLLVTGYSGIGKSALIHEIHRPIAQRSGFFIAGKFDQYRRNIPYSSLIQAFQSLLHQILAESEESIAAWKTRLLVALGGNGRVIIDVLPELRHIIGPQPEVPALAPQEAQNRFNFYFLNFIRTFADARHPLVMFLDDLQWADNPSLGLLEMLSADKECRHLLILGAYRSNEVDGAHPLSLTLEQMKANGVAVDEIALQSLPLEAVGEIVADTVNCPPEEVRPLAELIARKTDGNPFFIGQLLKTLHGGGLIAYDGACDAWTWQIEKIQEVGVSDNVAELMVAKIRSFSGETQQLLQLAACIGSQFTLDDLSVVGDDSWDSVAENILPALEAGLVSPVGNEYRFYGGTEKAKAGDFIVRYRFLHDRVQQAAYDLLDEEEKARTHFKAGQRLLRNTPEERLDGVIFDIVDHFNQAVALATDPALRLQLSRLNIQAAVKAKNAIAYEPALRYVRAARTYLGELSDDRLLFGVLVEQAECEHLNGNGDEAETLYRQALGASANDRDRAFVYERMIHYYTNTGKFRAAYDTGREALRLFGVSLPAGFVPPLFIADLARFKWKMRGRTIESLIDLPLCQDERLTTAMRLIGALLKAAYQIRPELCIASAVKAVNLSLSHGTMEDNAVAYVVLGGIFIGGVMGRRRAGYEFGRLALAMNKRFNNAKLSSEINFVSAYFTNFWVEPARNTETYYRTAYEDGLQMGDFFHLSCAACTLVESQFIRGVGLDEVRKAGDDYRAFMERIKSHEAAGAITAVLRAIRNLEGETESPASFGDAEFDEDAFVTSIGNFTSRHFAHFYFVNKMQALYLWGLHADALKIAAVSESYLKYSVAMLHTVEHHFYHALILCAAHRRTGERGHLRKARRILGKLEGWAALNPGNFAHKALLVRAELGRCGKGRQDLAPLYAAAIRSAGENGYAQNEALANELAGRYFAEQGIDMAAQGHFRAALYGYRMWGARGIADRLAGEFPLLESQGAPRDATAPWPDRMVADNANDHRSHTRSGSSSTTRPGTSGSRTRSSLDLETVIKATRALSGEIKLQTLLRKLVEIMIENAGAQRGVFIRIEQGRLLVEAAGTAGQGGVAVLGGEPPDGNTLPLSVVHYVVRLGDSVVLNDAEHDQRFWNDPYIQAANPKSVLCAPVIHQGQTVGIIYLENTLASGAFTAARLEMLEVLSTQAAISLENSILYERLEQRVAERTGELLQANEQLKATQSQLIEAEKMASLGQLVAGVAHEINTPLGVAVTANSFLSDETAAIVRQHNERQLRRTDFDRYLTVAQDTTALLAANLDRAARLVQSFKQTAANQTADQRQAFDLAHILRDAIACLEPAWRKAGHQVVLDCPPGITMDGYPGALANVLGILVMNSMDHAYADGERGLLTVAAADLDDDTVELACADNGRGIPREHWNKVFEPFFTTRRSAGNTGLGLHIAYNLTTARFGGRIYVDSAWHPGTRMVLRLPRRAPDQGTGTLVQQSGEWSAVSAGMEAAR
ncbi:MAG TPA: ATP-binding sensor histidine kinase [Azospirillum sp.]|nr:ATP-binding sensor histidine kinase [Azospirillum sp.]